MRILVTRPEPAASSQADQLCQRGHDPLVSPLLKVVLTPPDLIGVAASAMTSAVIATSSNALTSVARTPLPPQLRQTPCYCVGHATARAARQAGFQTVIAGKGNACDLASQITAAVSPDDGTLLRLAGDIPSAAPAALENALTASGYAVQNVACYKIEPAPQLTREATLAVRTGKVGVVILMSPLTAKTYLSAIKSAGLTIESESIRYVCLSMAVADELFGFPQEYKFVADKPDQSIVLSLVDRIASNLS